MHKSEVQTVGFLIFPGFPMACLTSMIEPLRAANEIAQTERFAWVLVSEDGEKIMSSAQVAFEPDCALHEVGDPDVLFLLSSPTARFRQARSSQAALRRLDRFGCTMGAISGGIFPLARAGLMQGERCSVHWCYAAAFRAEFPDLDAADDVIVASGRRATASGAAAAFDLALQMIDRAMGPAIAHEVACWFQHPAMRGEGVRQRVPIVGRAEADLPGLVGQAAALFAQRIDSPISVAEVADQIGVTPRQVERAFKKATGQSPSHYYRALRMKAARQLVLYSKDSLPQIASAVGYASSTPLNAHYQAAFGVTPKQDRTRINDFRVQGNVPLPSV